MSKDLPVTLNNAVIYHIQLKDSFSDLGKELINLGYMPDQKFCIVSDACCDIEFYFNIFGDRKQRCEKNNSV